MPKKFKYFSTPVPAGFEEWVDVSWDADGCASCSLVVPTKKHPDARLVLYVDEGNPRYTLRWQPNEFCGEPGEKKLYAGDSLKKLKEIVDDNC